jgi:hypothetical protein
MNDEMMMKGGSGTKCKPQYWENAERFLIYIFLHQKRKQCLEFTLPKPGEICILAGAYNSNSHAHGLHYLTFVCGKQAEKSMQWGESF